jgi:CheY-like chemotaxis protein
MMRILVAEDSPVNLLLIEKYLKDPSFEIDTARNGAVALAKFQSGAYDLVLMDLRAGDGRLRGHAQYARVGGETSEVPDSHSGAHRSRL